MKNSMTFAPNRKTLLILVVLMSIVVIVAPVYAQTVQQKSKVLFVLDGSGSMWGRLDGVEKIVVAKKLMTRLVQDLPDTTELGLQVYGHRSKGDCNDIELIAPIGLGNRSAIIEQINAINPKGKTPISASLALAVEQLQEVEEESTVVLISDGKETCNADPCALVKSARQRGVKMRVHVVGFDVGQEERDQLICIADAGAGSYYTANNAAQLANNFTEIQQELSQNKCATRNPFCVTDVPDPFDAGVSAFAAVVPSVLVANDPNAENWADSKYDTQRTTLEGYWQARWNGGGANAQWIAGTATVRIVQDVVYILYQDRTSTYLTEANILANGRLVGKYININSPNDSTPWVGNIDDANRIDGYWGSGRWDYRR